jgi:hypothetical protein
MTGKLLKGFIWICVSLLICLTYSCNDFDSFGSDLLDSDWINAKGVDTFKLTAKSAEYDSLITFRNGFTTLGRSNFVNSSFPIGKMVDPLFGNVTAGFGTQLRIITDNTNFLKRTVDSVVLSLRFDTSLFYGLNKEAVNISVYPLSAPFNLSSIYYSNSVLQYDVSKKLGGLTGYYPTKDSLKNIRENDTLVNVYPQLRIPMDTTVIMPILRSYPDSVYSTLDSFNIAFNGIAIVCEQGNGILSVLPSHTDSRMTVYYHDAGTSTMQSRQEFNMGSFAIKTPYYTIDNQNTTAAQCIDGTISGDSLLCLQGFEGRDIHLTIPYDSTWDHKFINFAVLQFYVAELPGDDKTNYSLPELLEVFDINSGTRDEIEDVLLGLNTLNNYKRIFGGNPIEKDVNGTSLYTYKMNITRHFQNAQKAKKPMELIISPLFKKESPARAVLFGPGHSQYPAKLLLTFSE